jgi:hypothetical protein
MNDPVYRCFICFCSVCRIPNRIKVNAQFKFVVCMVCRRQILSRSKTSYTTTTTFFKHNHHDTTKLCDVHQQRILF